jgi:hypothetical protein
MKRGARSGGSASHSSTEEPRRSHALSLGGVPDGFTAPPPWIARHIRIADGERGADACIPHGVGHDAMMLRMQPRDQRVVVGERLAGKRRHETLRAHAARGQRTQAHRTRPREVVRAKTVEGQQHGGMWRVLLRGGGAGAALRSQRRATDQQDNRPHQDATGKGASRYHP